MKIHVKVEDVVVVKASFHVQCFVSVNPHARIQNPNLHCHGLLNYTDGKLPNHEGKSEDRSSVFGTTSGKNDEFV